MSLALSLALLAFPAVAGGRFAEVVSRDGGTVHDLQLGSDDLGRTIAVYTTWDTSTGRSAIEAQTLGDGSAPFRVSENDGYYHSDPRIAVEPVTGRLAVSWPRAEGTFQSPATPSPSHRLAGDEEWWIRARVFDATGGAITPEIPVATATVEVSAGGQRVTIASDGSLFATWTARSYIDFGFRTEVLGRVFDPAGQPVGDTFLIAGENDLLRGGAACRTGTGAVPVSWNPFSFPSTARSTMRVYDDTGQPAAPPRTIDLTSDQDQGYVSVACARDGGFFASARSLDARRNFARRYDDLGRPVSRVMPLPSSTTAIRSVAQLATVGRGFLAVWWEAPPPPTYGPTVLRARWFSASGAPVGPAFPVTLQRAFDYAITAGPDTATIGWTSADRRTYVNRTFVRRLAVPAQLRQP